MPLGVCIDSDFFVYEIGKINVACNGEIESDEDSSDKINTFIKSHYLQLEPRSSLRVKGLIAGTGIIDLDYKDEVLIVFHNLLTFKAIVKWIFSFGRNKSVFKSQKAINIYKYFSKNIKLILWELNQMKKELVDLVLLVIKYHIIT